MELTPGCFCAGPWLSPPSSPTCWAEAMSHAKGHHHQISVNVSPWEPGQGDGGWGGVTRYFLKEGRLLRHKMGGGWRLAAGTRGERPAAYEPAGS